MEDESISSDIENDYLKFVSEWSDKKLFINQKKRNINGWKHQQQIRFEQNEAQLLLSLKYLGTGKMPLLWSKLKKFNFPVLLITGAEDEKYCNIATDCLQILPNARWVNISKCGHNVHLEHPNQFIEIIKNFID